MPGASGRLLLFDLDGTLTDPFEGITRSIAYAMERLGRTPPNADDLRWCIGPPLSVSFVTLLDTDDREEIDRAVGFYRERYSAEGKFENRLIEGIPEVLASLVDDGFRLVVATSKLHTYAGDIVDHFGLSRHIAHVYGSEADGRNASKADLIRHVLTTEKRDAGDAMMIGDRHHDIVGANENGVASVGVLWGFGDRAELGDAGATFIAATPAELPGQMKAHFAR